MKKILTGRPVIIIIIGAIILLANPVFAQTWRVDDAGNITLDGQAFKLKGGSWFGLEGRHEPCFQGILRMQPGGELRSDPERIRRFGRSIAPRGAVGQSV